MLRVCLISIFCLINVTIGNSIVPEIKIVEVKKERITVREKILGVLEDSCYSPRMQEIILAQAIHESGNFTNKLSKRWNNVFSIYKSKYDTLAIGNHGFAEGRTGWAVYRNVEDATKAYILYTKGRGFPKDTTLSAYVDFLKKKNYFTADKQLYYNSMKTIIDKQIR
jgi:uncharacterized FlgJ-related protein